MRFLVDAQLPHALARMLAAKGFLSGHVSALGAHFNVNLDRTEGMHQAVRILIQLGTVELLGRLAGLCPLRAMPDRRNRPGQCRRQGARSV